MAVMRSIYLVRHAIAAERGEDWPDDSRRPLTHEGAARMRQVVQGMRKLGVTLDLVLTSPLTRATETAAILKDGLSPHPRVVTLPVLAPGGTPARVSEALAAHPRCRQVALVGHEPEIGELAAWLIGAKRPFPFKKGGVCRIDTADWPPVRQGQLVWLATPRMLRGLA